MHERWHCWDAQIESLQKEVESLTNRLQAAEILRDTYKAAESRLSSEVRTLKAVAHYVIAEFDEANSMGFLTHDLEVVVHILEGMMADSAQTTRNQND